MLKKILKQLILLELPATTQRKCKLQPALHGYLHFSSAETHVRFTVFQVMLCISLKQFTALREGELLCNSFAVLRKFYKIKFTVSLLLSGVVAPKLSGSKSFQRCFQSFVNLPSLHFREPFKPCRFSGCRGRLYLFMREVIS